MNCPHGRRRAAVITKKCSDHEIFITKIFFHGIFSSFTKFLDHENLELYGIFIRLIVLTISQRRGELIIIRETKLPMEELELEVQGAYAEGGVIVGFYGIHVGMYCNNTRLENKGGS